MSTKLSIVIPVHNEAPNVMQQYYEVSRVLQEIDLAYEIIFVDDGSTDRTFWVLSNIPDKKLVVVKLRRKCGQSAALLAGFDQASGEIIVTLDGDLQNDPRDIPKLLAGIAQGYDCVSGWRYKRKDPVLIKMVSKLSNILHQLLIKDPVHDSGCSLKAYRRECLADLELYGEMHRYIVSLVKLKGFRIGEVKVNHRPRRRGTSKYSLYKVVKGFLDLWAIWFWQKFAGRPLHLFGGWGLLAMLFGLFTGSYAAFLRLFRSVDLSDTFLPIVAVFSVMIGLQLFVSGILADILIKNYNKNHRYRGYVVERILRR